MNSQQEIEREIAIYDVLVAKGEFTGENFVGARGKLLGQMLRPHDIHLVEQKAKQLYAQGTIFMRGRTLTLDVGKATQRVDSLMQSIDGDHPTCRSLDEALKGRIRSLAEQLAALEKSSQLALA